MKKITALVLFLFFSYSINSQSLHISEVMFYEPQANCEFIELYNSSETDSIDATQFKIKYYTSSPDVIAVGSSGKKFIPPKGFAVIFEGDYDFDNGIYKTLIPQNAIVLKIGDNAFGSSGMANTTSRPIYLLDASNSIIDSVVYSANNQRGYSEEKIILNFHPFSSSNWSNSTVYLGTPGYKNSVSPKDKDVGIKSLISLPAAPKVNENFTLRATVRNYAVLSANNVLYILYNDQNKDSIGQSGEIIYQQTISSLGAGEEATIDFVVSQATAGEYQFIAKCQLAGDENISNDNFVIKVVVSQDEASYNDIVINEIMYAPSTGQPEWVELYNKSDKNINLKNWKFSDNASTVTLSSSDYIFASKSYLILAKDTTIKNYFTVKSPILTVNIPTLNNDKDACVLKTNLNTIIDSVSYLSSWGGKNGFSLERISVDGLSNVRENWGTSRSPQKATPGYINSLSEKEYDIEVSNILFQPAAPLKGDDVAFSAILKNNGKFLANEVKCYLYLKLLNDTNYALVDSILGFQINSKDSAKLNFQFKVYNLQKNYEIKVLAKLAADQDEVNNEKIRILYYGYPARSIVVNEIMYLPAGGEPEWIEFYNNSNDTINIRDWIISDILTTPSRIKITSQNFYIPPKTYFIVAYDSTITGFYYDIPSQIIYVKIPTLNNTEDGVILYDNRNVAIDSVKYTSAYGGVTGKSLERIYFDGPSNDPKNWGASKDIENATPGRENSITPKRYNLSVEKIITSPLYPRNGNNVKLGAVIKNIGLEKADNFEVIFMYAIAQNQWNLLGEVRDISLNSNDSIIVYSPQEIQNVSQNFKARVDINFLLDEYLSDNQQEKNIIVGLKEKIILINEFKYAPKSPEPEWIEIINASSEPVNLKNWKIGDVLPSPSKIEISSNDLIIEPGGYIVVAKDTNIFSFYPDIRSKTIIKNFGTLGNKEDGIVIYDYSEAPIDSVYYNSKWGGADGFSLERISFEKGSNDSTNWKPTLSNNFGTPGKTNSYNFARNYQKYSLVVNEIMYNPKSGKAEYIEFYNLSGDTLDLGGWTILDHNQNKYLLSKTFYKLPPFEYFILASDSTVFELNRNIQYITLTKTSNLGLTNEGELILVKDAFGNSIDSVLYSPKWHNKNLLETKGISLEKINYSLPSNDSYNWSSSVDPSGGTPGKQNSIFTTTLSSSAKVDISPNPFSPDMDGYEDFAVISYNLTKPLSQIRIRIFDSQGRLVRKLADNIPSASNGTIIFDGFDDSGKPLKIGIYILLLEAINENSNVVETVKKAFVIARKL